MNNYLQQSNFRPQVHQVPPYQGAAFRGAPPPPYPNIPQRPSMPAQLGNALTQMMQLKGMRTQNKLADFQMQQAKAAQEQAQAQMEASAKLIGSYTDNNQAYVDAVRAGVPLQTVQSFWDAKEKGNFDFINMTTDKARQIQMFIKQGDMNNLRLSLGPKFPINDSNAVKTLSARVDAIVNLGDEANYKSQTLYKNGKEVEAETYAQFMDYTGRDWTKEKPAPKDKPEDLSAEEKAIDARMKTHPDETYEVARANVAAGMKSTDKLSPPEIYKRISQIEITRARLHAGESLTEEDYASMPEGTAAILKALGKAKPDPKTLKTADEALTAERQILEGLLPKEYRIQPPVEAPKSLNEYDVQRDPKTGRLFVGQ